MKKFTSLFIVLFFCQNVSSQKMNSTKLDKILMKISDSIVRNKSQWHFKIKEIPFICIADFTHNRMRILSPITDSNRLTEELKTRHYKIKLV